MIFEKPKSLRTMCVPPLVGICMASSAWAQTAPPAPASSGTANGSMRNGMSGSSDMMDSMIKGMGGMQKMQMSGETDKDFAMMMKMHHQQGVEMAQMELAKGKSAEMKAMAKSIIAAQNQEIVKFDQWLARQK